MAFPTKAKITAFVCNGLNLPKLNHEIPSVKFGNKNINARSKPTVNPTFSTSTATKHSQNLIFVAIIVLLLMMVMLLIVYIYCKRRKAKHDNCMDYNRLNVVPEGRPSEDYGNIEDTMHDL